jgi:hypothetical protein
VVVGTVCACARGCHERDRETQTSRAKQVNEICILGSVCAKHNAIGREVGMLRQPDEKRSSSENKVREKNAIERMRIWVAGAGPGSGNGGDVRTTPSCVGYELEGFREENVAALPQGLQKCE